MLHIERKKSADIRALTEQLKEITEQLRLLTKATQAQNNLLKSCVFSPEDKQARLMIGTAGAIETFNLN